MLVRRLLLRGGDIGVRWRGIMWGLIGMFSRIAVLKYHAYLFSAGEKVTVKAHGGLIDIQGMLVAKMNEKFQIQSLDIWYDPMEMFRQIGCQSKCPLAPAPVDGSERP